MAEIGRYFARGPSPRRLLTLCLGAVLAVIGAALVPGSLVPPIALGAAFGLLTLALSGVFIGAFTDARVWVARHRAVRRARLSGVPVLVEAHGKSWANDAARTMLSVPVGGGVEHVLSRFTIDPVGRINRVRAMVQKGRTARDSIRTEAGHLSLSVSQRGPDVWEWKITHEEASASDQPTPVLSLDETGNILSANSAAHTLLGRVPSHIGNVLSDIPAVPGAMRRATTALGHIDVAVFEVSLDGRRDLHIVPTHPPNVLGNPLATPGLLEAMPVPMLKIAVDGTVLGANSEARDVFELAAGASLPPLYELVEGMGRPISEWLTDAARGRDLLRPQIVRAALPGKEVFLQIALGRAEDAGETVLYGILNDATELKTLEGQFVQSQKMQAIGQLAGGIAHDFNNLLTAISGHCDLLLLRHDAEDPDYADLIQIEQNANRAASLVSQLLAFSRKQNMKPQAVDLRESMSELAHLLNRLIGERVNLEVAHRPGLLRIRADRRQLEQVIINLVVNARDAMPDGGKILIESRAELLSHPMERDRATVPAGDYVVITVTDSGVGISPEVIDKVFEPFYTTKTTGEGTGLGLSTAYGIIKQTGGFIFVDSTVGQGTCFTLYLPASHEEEVVEVEAVPAHAKPLKSATGDGVVLLVEDEAPVRAFASRALRLRGYTVIEAASAEEALDTLNDESLNVDIFVTDVVMPGMDGPTWVRQALVERPDTRVIFVSGYSEEGRAEKQSRIPNSVFLPKPFSLDQLTSLVQEQIV